MFLSLKRKKDKKENKRKGKVDKETGDNANGVSPNDSQRPPTPSAAPEIKSSVGKRDLDTVDPGEGS